MKKQNKLLLSTYLFALVALGIGCKKKSSNEPIPQQTDSIGINGKQYPVVNIGNQQWTALNYSGPGGSSYNSSGDKPEYGKYYTFEEISALQLPDGWKLPSRQDYLDLAQQQGIIFTGNRATSQEAIKKLASTSNWRSIPGTNASGFNAQPGGYCFQDGSPQDGDIAEFWTGEGITFSMQEGANGKTHNASFYGDSNSPEYRFNARFVKIK